MTGPARMVEEQLRARGIRDARVLAAMRKVPRERFVAEAQREQAYDDTPLPIGGGQTISQPFIVARMLELAELAGDERVLDVGAGSGYGTALLAELALQVFAVERIVELGRRAEQRVRALGYRNVTFGFFDGSWGWREHAPYDAILVGAGAPSVPVLLADQLAPGGRLVIPVGPRGRQQLLVVTRDGEGFHTLVDCSCAFVDLVGRYGWGGEGPPRA